MIGFKKKARLTLDEQLRQRFKQRQRRTYWVNQVAKGLDTGCHLVSHCYYDSGCHELSVLVHALIGVLVGLLYTEGSSASRVRGELCLAMPSVQTCPINAGSRG